MLFDYTTPTDPNKPENNRQLLREYNQFKTKFTNAVGTEKKARPWWTALSSFASSFIPFGLGAIITPAAKAGVETGKREGNEKLNAYRRQLGLPEEADTSSPGLDLSGVGGMLGSGIQSAIGGGQQDEGQQQQQYDFTPTEDYKPTAPAQTGGGTTGLENLGEGTSYFGNGAGSSGLISTTQNGYTVAPQNLATMRNGGKISGGKINAPSHEEGGVDLVKDGKKVGIEVEGSERIVNDKDWTKVLSLLEKGKDKTALSLLKNIDKRKPKEGKAEGGINLLNSNTGYEDFSGGTTSYIPQNSDNQFAPQEEITIQETVNPLTNKTNSFAQPKSKFDWQNALGYGVDMTKLGLGISEAVKSLPQYNLPKEYGNYMDKARYFSEQGLLPEEKAEALDLGNQAYAANVRDITNASGGNAGVLLGNLGAVNLGRYRIANQLALADRKAKEASFDKYGMRLMNDIALKKDIFDAQLNQAVANKKEGMGLASDALANLQGRMDLDKYYGQGSYYDKLQKALVAKGASEADIAKQMADHASDPKFWLAADDYLKNNPNASDAEVEKAANKIVDDTKGKADKILNPKTTSYADYLTWKSGKK